MLCAMMREPFAGSPELAGRCREFSADRGYDQEGLKKELWDDYGVRPLIDTWPLWREERMRFLIRLFPLANTGQSGHPFYLFCDGPVTGRGLPWPETAGHGADSPPDHAIHRDNVAGDIVPLVTRLPFPGLITL